MWLQHTPVTNGSALMRISRVTIAMLNAEAQVKHGDENGIALMTVLPERDHILCDRATYTAQYIRNAFA